MLTLAQFLDAALKNKGMTYRSFAQSVNIHNTFYSHVRAGRRPLPFDQFSKWCASLSLDHNQIATFRELLVLTNSDQLTLEYISDLKKRIISPQK
jgi:cyanate lyase